MLLQAEITAARLAVPPTRQSTEELTQLISCQPDWIARHLGVRSRYVSRMGDDPAELAAQPAREVIELRGEPELIIYASATVRQLLPDTAVFVARQLGLSGIACYSLHATCLSFLMALHQAALVINSGQYRKVLIVCAEMATLSRDMQQAESTGLLGDGAAAVMVERTSRACGVQYFKQATWPEHAELSQVRGGGLLNHPLAATTRQSDYYFEMDGEQLLRATLPKLKRFLDEFFQQSGLTIQDIDWLIPHQASAAGMRLLEKLGFASDRTANIIADYGNCVAASMPMALSVTLDKIKPGDRVMFLGSAAGLSLGAVLWQM